MDEMDERAVADLVERATEAPRPEFASAVRAAVMDELATAPAGVDRVTGPRRGWLYGLSVAAVIALVVAGIVVGTGRDGDRVSTTAADPGTPFLLPTVWPAGMEETATQTITSDQIAESSSQRSTVFLADEDVLRATATLWDSPVPASFTDEAGNPTGTEVTLSDGRAATYVDGEVPTLWFAVSPDRSLYLLAPETPGETLEELALAFTDPDGQPSVEALPPGWKVVDAPSGLLAMTSGGVPDPTLVWYVASRYSGGGEEPFRTVAVVTTEVADAAAAIDRAVAEIGDERARPAELPSGVHGYLVDALGYEATSFVWAPSPGIVAMVSGEGLTDQELFVMAGSVEPVTQQEWLALAAEEPSSPDATSQEQMPTTTVVADPGCAEPIGETAPPTSACR